jgi:hypothetical protein
MGRVAATTYLGISPAPGYMHTSGTQEVNAVGVQTQILQPSKYMDVQDVDMLKTMKNVCTVLMISVVGTGSLNNYTDSDDRVASSIRLNFSV